MKMSLINKAFHKEKKKQNFARKASFINRVTHDKADQVIQANVSNIL